MAASRHRNNHGLCRPLHLTRREARMLLVNTELRVDRLMRALETGMFTGEEVHRRIQELRAIIGKLEDCLDGH